MKINYDFYKGNENYNDGNVENELLEYYKNEKFIDLSREDVFFYTTEIRENIINWYPFKKNASIIEIGAGLGTITGSLCKNAKKVVAVEGSKRRAEIIASRHRNEKNLEIYCANFKDIKFQEKFDYIVLIGVFEYSKIFYNTTKPFDDFLNDMKKILNPKGKILIAIENRYGIKYWAGLSEDHFREKFISLEGYDNNNGAQTFGKEELINLFKRNNLNAYKFYYVFPDYKLPKIIYTDNYIPKSSDVTNLVSYNYYNDKYNFSAQKTLQGIIDNKMSDFFANSFFIEISKEPQDLSNVYYVKFQNERSNDYKTMTLIENNIIKKYPLNNKSEKHLKNLAKTHRILLKNGIACSKVFSDHSIEYIKGNLLSEVVRNYILSKDYDKAVNEIYRFIDYLISITKKTKITNPYIEDIKNIWSIANTLPLGLFDIHPDNIILNDNKYIFIDQEWSTNKQLPIEYNIYITLNVLYYNFPELNKKITLYELFEKYDLTKEKIEIFEKCRDDFFNKNNKLNFEDKKIKDLVSNKTKEDIFDFEKKYKDLENVINKYKKDIINLKEENKTVNNLITEKNNLLNNLNKELNDIKEQNNNLTNVLNQEKGKYDQLLYEYNNVVGSKSWTLTKPLRSFSYNFREIKKVSKKYLVLILRKIYFLIPISLKNKRKILNFFEDNFALVKKIRRCDYNISLNGGNKEVFNNGQIIIFGNVANEVTKSIAIHVHMYYIDLIDEFIKYLNNIPYRFDLFISVPTKSHIEIIKKSAKEIRNLSKLKIKICKNIGRDISPFFVEFGHELREYDYICHIHTKKSVRTGSEQDGWRNHLMSSVLGSEYIIKNIFYIFENMADIGMIYPETYKDMPYWAHCYLQNKSMCSDLCKTLEVAMPEEYFDYSVGSFFWARGSALKKLFNANFTYSNFGKEEGKNDGTFAHAIERMLPYAALSAGYKYLVIDIYKNIFRYSGNKNLWQYCCQNEASIFEKIDRYSTVSFDIFDTLITRKVYSPEVIKDIIGVTLKNDYGICIDNFRDIRNKAEYNIRLRNNFTGDVTIDEIYLEIKKITNLTNEQINIVKNIEKKMELKYCTPREESLKIFNIIKDSGKKINLVTDMYLDRETISQILNNCGYHGWSNMYLSSELKRRKDDNSMWYYYFEKEPNSIHIGDNEKSDIQAVCDLKHEFVHVMNGVTIFKNTDYGKFLNVNSMNLTIDDNIILGLIVNKCAFNSPLRENFKIIANNYNDFGYIFLGPLFLKFFSWLEEETAKRKNDKLLFLAREGYYFEKLYHDYCKLKNVKPLDSEYFLASRRSVSVAALKNISDVEMLFSKYYKGKLINLFNSRLGLEINEADEHIELPKDKEKCLEIFKKYSKKYFENIKIEADEYKNYVKKCLSNFKKVAVVDLGYSGTIQYYLSKLMNYKFDGYYVIVNENVISKKIGCNVYNCFNYENKDTYEDIVLYNSLILESFLTAPFGQLLKFKNGKPIYKDDILSDTELMNLNHIYEGVFKFLKDFIELNPNFDYKNISNVLICKNFFSLVMVNEILNPQLEKDFKLEDKYCSDEISNVFELLKSRIK